MTLAIIVGGGALAFAALYGLWLAMDPYPREPRRKGRHHAR